MLVGCKVFHILNRCLLITKVHFRIWNGLFHFTRTGEKRKHKSDNVSFCDPVQSTGFSKQTIFRGWFQTNLLWVMRTLKKYEITVFYLLASCRIRSNTISFNKKIAGEKEVQPGSLRLNSITKWSCYSIVVATYSFKFILAFITIFAIGRLLSAPRKNLRIRLSKLSATDIATD